MLSIIALKRAKLKGLWTLTAAFTSSILYLPYLTCICTKWNE